MENRFSKFTLLISNINRSINKIKSAEMGRFDLKSSHVSCLYYIYKNSESSLTASELCSLCDEDKGTISRALNNLEDNGYIECTYDSKKKYRAKLFLTKKGCEIGQKIVKISDDIVEFASKDLSEKDRVILYKSLDNIACNLNKLCENYGEKYGD